MVVPVTQPLARVPMSVPPMFQVPVLDRRGQMTRGLLVSSTLTPSPDARSYHYRQLLSRRPAVSEWVGTLREIRLRPMIGIRT